MARCPHCNAVLADNWIKAMGASLMGKSGGRNKARSTASAAARARWDKKKKKEALD
jgi:hypothetical protein